MPRSLVILSAVFALTAVCAFADPIPTTDVPVTQEVVYLGNTYCINQTYCPDFAPWFGVSGGYVEFLGPNGAPAEYIWTNTYAGHASTLTFEDLAGCLSCTAPPAYDPLLGVLNESPNLQQVNQFFPGAANLPLFVLSSSTTPEPSTLLLFGSAGVLVFGTMRRRFWRP
jgi:PEP-CTERM motif